MLIIANNNLKHFNFIFHYFKLPLTKDWILSGRINYFPLLEEGYKVEMRVKLKGRPS